jgi:hypothetical protein
MWRHAEADGPGRPSAHATRQISEAEEDVETGARAARPRAREVGGPQQTWRREYNEERPKKGLGGLTPAAYAQQLTATTKTAKVTAGL